MEDLSLCRIAALVPEFAGKDQPLGRTLMMMMNIFTAFIYFVNLNTYTTLEVRLRNFSGFLARNFV